VQQTLDPKKPAIEQRWSDDDHDDAQQDATEHGLVKPQRESDPSTEGGKSQPRPRRPTA
jgi:hypothetical protein